MRPKPHNVPKKPCVEGKGLNGYCAVNFSKGVIVCKSCPIRGRLKETSNKMKNFTKIDTAHASKFGISGVSDTFCSLIDRLQRHSEWKYPERKWTIDTYYGIAFQWVGKEKELEERVLKLEGEMKAITKE